LLLLPVALTGCWPIGEPIGPTQEEPIPLLPSQEVGFGAVGRFQVGHDGSANYTIPLVVPSGRRGVQPNLTLSYNSNGPDIGVGVGWEVSGTSAVSRCRRSMVLDGAPGRVEFVDSDALCIDGRRLVHVGGSGPAEDGAQYRPQRDGLELIILHNSLGDAASWFEVRLPDGGRLEYGNSPLGNSLVRGLRFDSDLDGLPVPIGEATKRWLISRREDIAGNYMTYSYGHDLITTETERMGYTTFLSQIRYTGHASLGDGLRDVGFEYYASPAERQDHFDNGFWEYSSRTLWRVSMHAPGDTAVARRYDFAYELSSHTRRPLLTTVTLCDGAGQCLTPTGFSYTSNDAPAVEFGVEDLGSVPSGWYSSWAVGEEVGSLCARAFNQTFVVADLDGSGEDDLLYLEETAGSCVGGVEAGYDYRIRLNTGNGLGPGTGAVLGPAVPAGIPSESGVLPALPPLVTLDIDDDGQVDVFDRRVSSGLLGIRIIRREWDLSAGQLAIVDPDVFGCAAPTTGEPFQGIRLNVLDRLLIGDVDGNGSSDLMTACHPPCTEETGACSTIDDCCPGMVCSTSGECSYPTDCLAQGWACGFGSAACCGSLECFGSQALPGVDDDGNCAPPEVPVRWFVMPQLGVVGSAHDTFAAPEFLFEGQAATSSEILMDTGGAGYLGMLITSLPAGGPLTHYSSASMDPASSSPTFAPTNIPIPPTSTLVYLDLNGDGLADVLDLAGGDAAEIRLNSGRGLIEPMPAYLPSAPGTVLPAGTYLDRNSGDVRVVDFNADGRDDFLLLYEGDIKVPGDTVYVLHYATDAGFVRYVGSLDAEPLYIPSAGPGLPAFRSWNTVQIGDLDGDSQIDIVAANHTSMLAYYNMHARPDLLSTVTLAPVPHDVPFVRVHYASINSGHRIRSFPSGSSSRVLYESIAACDWPQRCVRRGVTVVERHSEISTTDETLTDPAYLANLEDLLSAHFEYTYSDAVLDTRGQGFLGFRERQMRQWEAIPFEPPSTGYAYSRRDWMRTRWNYDLTTVAEDGMLAFAGVPVSMERHVVNLVDGRYHAQRTEFGFESVLPAEFNSPGTIPLVFGRPVSTRFSEYDLPAEPMPAGTTLGGNPDYSRRVTSSVAYDDFSVPIHWTRATEGGEYIQTDAVPEQDPPANLLLRYGSTTTTSISPGAVESREVVLKYDETSGLLSSVTTNPSDPQRIRVTNMEYTATGVVERTDESAWDPDAAPGSDPVVRRTSHVTYDPEEIFPETIGVDLDGVTLTSSWMFHPALGVLQRATGPNRAVTELRHDGFGRLRRVDRPGGARVRYDYSAPTSAFDQIVTEVRSNSRAESHVTIDAFGRTRHSRLLSEHAGQWWAQSSRFDTRGQLVESSVPHEEGATPLLNHFDHDDLGRIVRVTEANEAVTDFTYGRDPATGTRQVETHTPLGHRYVQTLDADLRLHEVIEPGDVRTRYTYGPFGLLRRVDLHQGAFRTYGYDSNGLLHTIEDSAVGVRRAERDGFGDIFRLVQADGTASEMRYDGGGRLVSQRSPVGESRFWYDTTLHGMGLLGHTRAEDGTEEDFTYDSAGRPDIISQTTSAGATVRSDYDYSTNGQLHAVRTTGPSGGLAGGAGLEYVYTNGYLMSVRSAELPRTPIWRATQLHPQGFVAQEEFASGLIVQRDLDATDREVSFHSEVQALDVNLDEEANVRSITDDRDSSGGAQEFTYDDRNRLASWAWTGTPLSATYAYDDLGNVQRNESASLTYDPSTHLLATIDGIPVTHDLRGRAEVVAGRNITWRDFGLFDEVQDTATGENVEFDYTAAQDRAGWQSSDGRSSVQMGETYRRDQDASGVTETFGVPGATRIVAELISENGSALRMRFLHDDHLGSTAVVSDGAGEVQRFWHSPFGRRVDPAAGDFLPASEDFDVRPRFTSHQTDGQAPSLGAFGGGFIHMQGREYDPVVGRFLSQDPMTPVSSSAGGWNPYAYVLNNPSTVVDPSGYGPFDFLAPPGPPGVPDGGAASIDPASIPGYPGMPAHVRNALAYAWRNFGPLADIQSRDPRLDLYFDAGVLSGLGVPGLPPPSHRDPARQLTYEEAYYQGQLLGSRTAMALDAVTVVAGLSVMSLGDLSFPLGISLGALLGPEAALAGAVISVPAWAVGGALVVVGAGFLPGHAAVYDDAVRNLDRVHMEGTPSGSGGGGATSRVLLRTQRQLQRKFRHAADFGVTGNYSRANATEFSRAIDRHLNAPGTRQIAGTYRGNSVVHNVDPATGLNVIEDTAGNFVSGWRLNAGQLRNVLTRGSL